MSALRKPIRRKGMAVWQLLCCLTVISFLCRSVIPMGYMPDVSGTRNGTFAVTFCTMDGGISTLTLDLSGQPEHSSSDDHSNIQDCPFSLLASQVIMPYQAAPVLTGIIPHRPAPLLHRNQSLPPLPALGPPLGSRAPPSNLG